MKKFFYGIACLMTAAVFSSCNNSDPVFQVFTQFGYGLQLSDYTFTPSMCFVVTNGTFDKSATTIKQDGVTIRSSYVADNYIVVSEQYTDVEDMSGSYVLSGVSTSGEKIDSYISMKFDKPMGSIEVKDFKYEQNKLKMTVVTPVENADEYAFFIRPVYNNGQTATAWTTCAMTRSVDAGNKDEQEVTLNFDSTSDWSGLGQGVESIKVYPAALRSSDKTTLLVRIGTVERNLKKDGTLFEEDKANPAQ